MSLSHVTHQGQALHRWQVGASTFLAAPERGARLLSWHLTLADGTVREIIYWPEQADWTEIARVRGGNPILFPFSGRCYVDGKEGFWRDGNVVRPMPMHGFARQGKFVVEQADEGGFQAMLQPTGGDATYYPYPFSFSVVYRFRELSLHVEFRFRNEHDRPLPWSPGHHFYFRLPWHAGLKREDYRICLPAKKAWYRAADGRLVAAGEVAKEDSLGNPALVDRIHTHFKENAVRFGPRNGEEDVVVRLGVDPVPTQDAAFVTWTLSDESPFYCVEPWMGPPNGPDHGKGLQWIEPGQTATFAVEVALA